MGTGNGCSRDPDGVTIGKPYLASVSVPRESSPLPNEIFVVEADG